MSDSEVREIVIALGRGADGADFRGTHLNQILTYLKRTKRENKKITLCKLALVCGMAVRQIRENYFDGLEAFGIVEMTMEKSVETWNWIGLTAISDDDITQGENLSEYAKRRTKEKLLAQAEKKPEPEHKNNGDNNK